MKRLRTFSHYCKTLSQTNVCFLHSPPDDSNVQMRSGISHAESVESDSCLW